MSSTVGFIRETLPMIQSRCVDMFLVLLTAKFRESVF